MDAYLDDTAVLEYARITMDVKCLLRLVGEGFGEDGYGIGLPKGSWLKVGCLIVAVDEGFVYFKGLPVRFAPGALIDLARLFNL